VCQGVSSADSSVVANVRRGVLCGRNAMAFASKFSGALTDADVMKNMNGNTPFKFMEQLKDYDYIFYCDVEYKMIIVNYLSFDYKNKINQMII
jgi:hypothetical protein